MLTSKDLQLCVDLDWNCIQYPCIVEPKIDGFRCLVTVDDDGTVHAWSRSGREWPKVAAALSELARFKGAWLDGELQIGGSWATTNATMKRDEFSPDDVHLYVFDGSPEPRQFLWFLDFPRVSTVSGIWCGTRSDIEAAYQTVLGNGFEGIVVKKMGASYRGGRTGNWMKLKPQPTQNVFKNGKWLEQRDGQTVRVREIDR